MNCYPFIEAEKQGRRNVRRACELLKVSRAACYAARDGQPSGRDRQDADTPTGVQVVETSAAIDDVTEERPWAAHTNHYISDKFQTVANSEEESVQRLEEAVATLGGVSDRELMKRARFLVQSPGFVPRSPDHSTVTAFVMLADIEAGSVQTAPGGGGRRPWVGVTVP